MKVVIRSMLIRLKKGEKKRDRSELDEVIIHG